jgi:predicted SprT family Zn-dependent metalloprotease
VSRPATPPAPPSPTKKVSPSKKKNRIPQAPDLRPSLDAFWAVDVVNNWNDAHSPAKTLLSPRKQKWLQGLEKLDPTSSSDEDAPFPSPTTSPRKKNNPAPSPSKKPSNSTSPSPSQLRAQRKAFATTKHTLAASFLTELDETITSGKIASLSASTGGIKLIWSKTLKTTAGRANWRREPIRRKIGPSITDIATSYRHHCSIELAEKVIDDEERLYNVLAHEYCHLTTFMISEVRNNPHGKEFKTWAAEVSRRFEQKGVHVTTKHSYQIEYKYVWTCVGCGYEFKRHSKSVDTSRHSCGRCKGKLVQTKPTPRGGGGAADGKEGKPREKSEYQVFVKENFARVKRELGEKGLDTQMGRVMETVAREYREAKERKAGLGEVEELLGGLKI